MEDIEAYLRRRALAPTDQRGLRRVLNCSGPLNAAHAEFQLTAAPRRSLTR
jgi:hypothetical protein